MYGSYGINSNTRIRVKNITKLLIEAYNQKQEDDLFEMWKLQFPNMDKETFISFDEYKVKLMARKHTEITYDDIEKEMDKVIKAYEERR